MEAVTSLESYRHNTARRPLLPRRASPPPRFYFDLSSPYTYLAVERADRMFAGLRWLPASADALQCATFICEDERDAIRRRAALLGLPLVWPAARARLTAGAMRVAALASERGMGAAFVLAACRLEYCGGYSIEDPEILAEAAAAAGIDLAEMLRAAGDLGRDGPIEEAGRRLLAAGADRLPALRVGRLLFCGEERLSEAVAARASA